MTSQPRCFARRQHRVIGGGVVGGHPHGRWAYRGGEVMAAGGLGDVDCNCVAASLGPELSVTLAVMVDRSAATENERSAFSPVGQLFICNGTIEDVGFVVRRAVDPPETWRFD